MESTSRQTIDPVDSAVLAGPDAERRLDEIGITVNRNPVPNDPRPRRPRRGSHR